jgi:uncharacterized membrane protein YhaH (DUF805 family)
MPLKDLLFSFNGRIRRSQYWITAIVVSLVFGVVIGVVMSIVVAANAAAFEQGQVPAIFWIVYLLSSIPLMWISLALAVKRWHDRDKSGWWVLIAFIPIIGGIWTLIECGFLDGTQGPNKFGPSPKGIGTAEKVF